MERFPLPEPFPARYISNATRAEQIRIGIEIRAIDDTYANLDRLVANIADDIRGTSRHAVHARDKLKALLIRERACRERIDAYFDLLDADNRAHNAGDDARIDAEREQNAEAIDGLSEYINQINAIEQQ